jgi:hypothetical protein
LLIMIYEHDMLYNVIIFYVKQGLSVCHWMKNKTTHLIDHNIIGRGISHTLISGLF